MTEIADGTVKIEAFARETYASNFHGRTIGEWGALLSSGNESAIRNALSEKFSIGDVNATKTIIR